MRVTTRMCSFTSCSLFSCLLIPCLLVSHVSWAQWTEDDRENGCIRYRGAKRAQVIPMRVICIWPVSARALKRVIKAPQHFDRCFSRVEKSELIDTATLARGFKLIRVYQVHNASPASDRALYIDYREEQVGGAWRMRFEKSPPSQVEPITDFVEVKQNQGYWQVEAHPQGAKLTFEGRYDPGGSVPSFLVRWFLSGGVQSMMDELRACATRS